MTSKHILKSLFAVAGFCCFAGAGSAAQIINNGTFTAGLSGWTKADQAGSDGTFYVQSGTVSPSSGTTVPAPIGPPNAAMTDSQGPGTHVLYQDFVLTAPVVSAAFSFDAYLGNQAGAYYVPSPASLDFSAAAFNQQARVDILLAS